MIEIQQVKDYCRERELPDSETEMVMRIADLCGKPTYNPDMKKLMEQVSVIRLEGITMTMKDIEKQIAKPVALDTLCPDEIEDHNSWVESMRFNLGRLEEMRNQEGLRLGRLWGELFVHDDDHEPPATPAAAGMKVEGMVGYTLGETMYFETDDEIAQERINEYYTPPFKGRNGEAEKPPEGSD